MLRVTLARRSAALSRRALRAGLPVRHLSGGFFSSLKDNIQKEMEKNPELKQTLKDLRENTTLNEAAKAARDAAEQAQSAASKAGESAASAASAAGKAGAEAASAAREAAESAAEAARESDAAKAARAAADEAREALGKAQEQMNAAGGGASASSDAGGADAGADAGAGAGAGAEGSTEPPLPLYQALMQDAREMWARLTTSSAANKPIDHETTTVAVKEPSFWEKTFNQASDSAAFRGFAGAFGKAGDAAGSATDRILGQTEQAEARELLREVMPSFSQDEFLKHLKSELMPQVIGAYLKGDDAVLRTACREQAYALLHASVMERQARQLKMDPRILHMSDPEIVGYRIIGGNPTPVVSFEAHQLHCVRDLKGKVVEGDEDDIRAVYYLFALQPFDADATTTAAGAGAGAAEEAADGEGDGEGEEPKEEAPPPPPWQVTELAVQGSLQTY